MPPQLILFLHAQIGSMEIGGVRSWAGKLFNNTGDPSDPRSSINTYPPLPTTWYMTEHALSPSMAIHNIPTKGHAASWRKNPVPAYRTKGNL